MYNDKNNIIIHVYTQFYRSLLLEYKIDLSFMWLDCLA